jgi:hypothetical protein
MPGVTVFEGVWMPGVAVDMIGAIGMCAHVPYSTRSAESAQPSGALSGQFDTSSSGMD